VETLPTSTLTGQPLPSGVLVCLSQDANWLLTWPPQPDRPQSASDSVQPPTLQRIVWIRTGPITDRDNKWYAQLAGPRNPGTSQSYDDLTDSTDGLNREYSRLYEAVREGRQVFRFFRSGDNVGFLIAMAPDRTAMFWTTTGLLDPDLVEFPLKHPLSECRFVPYSKADEKGQNTPFMRCEMGPIAFDGLAHRLIADYKVTVRAPQPATPAEAFNCEPEGELCRTELQIVYDPPDDERGSQRVSFLHVSSTIKAAAIWNDALWVRDANGQVWRYLVGLGAIKELLPHRWKGDPDLAKSVYSKACEKAKCDKVKIPEWP